MKLNARIRQYLTRTNHWHSAEVFAKMRTGVDNIEIYQKSYRRDQPSTFRVSHRCYGLGDENNDLNQQHWYSEFGIRDSIGNPTDLGKMMGIKTRDKRISIFSPKGQAIQEFLHRVAWIDACRLTHDRTQIKGGPYSKGAIYREEASAA